MEIVLHTSENVLQYSETGKSIFFNVNIATLEKICNGFWIPENIRFTVNVDARVLQKV